MGQEWATRRDPAPTLSSTVERPDSGERVCLFKGARGVIAEPELHLLLGKLQLRGPELDLADLGLPLGELLVREGRRRRARRRFVTPKSAAHARLRPPARVGELAHRDVKRFWKHIASRATSIDEPDDIPNELGSLSAAQAVNLVLEGRIECLSLRVRGLRPSRWVLPDVFLEVTRDGLSVYWWVGHPEDNWNRETAAGLADLLSEMWQVVPDARLEAEHHYPHEFWDPIDRYRRATALAAAPAEPSEGDVGDTLGSSA